MKFTKNEPIVALVPMEEFLRLKGLEEYLDDIAIAKIIEERLANRDRTQTHPLRDFDGFRGETLSNTCHCAS